MKTLLKIVYIARDLPAFQLTLATRGRAARKEKLPQDLSLVASAQQAPTFPSLRPVGHLFYVSLQTLSECDWWFPSLDSQGVLFVHLFFNLPAVFPHNLYIIRNLSHRCNE